jgi:hypothetical protein
MFFQLSMSIAMRCTGIALFAISRILKQRA